MPKLAIILEKNNVYFLFLFEYLKWGPTSLHTVMRDYFEHPQFVRSWGPKTENKKYTLF